MTRLMKILAVIVVVTIVCISYATSSEGYSLNGKKWPPASILYDYHTLSSSWQSATSYGSGRWNISGSLFEWAPSSSGENDITLGSIDGAGKILGATSTWPQNACGTITRATIVFDKAEKWYLDSGTSPGSSYFDARSAAAHEFGHGLGLGHTQSSRCTGSETTRPTMCDSFPSGKTYFRTLEQDDKNGVTSLYSHLSSSKGCTSVEYLTPSVDFLYASISMDKAIEESQLIVRGVVTDISETTWNQDNGQYWEDESPDGTTLYSALPLYTVRIEPLESLLPGSRPMKLRPIIVTIFGESPMSHPGEGSPFEVGREAVIFAKSGEIAWRGGMKNVIQLVGSPNETVLLQGKDGLFYAPAKSNEAFQIDSLMEKVAKLRTTPADF